MFVLLFRFEDWKSERSESSEREFSNDGQYRRNARESVRAVLGNIGRGFQRGCERIRSLRNTPTSRSVAKNPEKEFGSRKKILDPQGSMLQKWNKIFVLSCFIAVSVDPLFFYIPVIDDTKKCLSLDRPLEIIACVLRTFVDLFYVVRIIFQFRTGFIAPSSRVFGRGELIDDPTAIAKRYLSSHFIVDVLSILPLPQVYSLSILS